LPGLRVRTTRLDEVPPKPSKTAYSAETLYRALREPQCDKTNIISLTATCPELLKAVNSAKRCKEHFGSPNRILPGGVTLWETKPTVRLRFSKPINSAETLYGALREPQCDKTNIISLTATCPELLKTINSAKRCKEPFGSPNRILPGGVTLRETKPTVRLRFSKPINSAKCDMDAPRVPGWRSSGWRSSGWRSSGWRSTQCDNVPNSQNPVNWM